MSAVTLREMVSALRSYQTASRSDPTNPNILSTWMQRNSNPDYASEFSSDATIAILHYYNHPLYGNIANVSSEAQAWITHVQPAESILAQEESWLDMQIAGLTTTNLVRIFTTDKQWLETWGGLNNLANVPMAYIINHLITRLQVCEGNNGPTGAGGISHTPQEPPSIEEIP